MWHQKLPRFNKFYLLVGLLAEFSTISSVDLFKTQPTHGEANGFDRRPAYVSKIINNYSRGHIIQTPYLPYDLKFVSYSGTYQEREFDAFNDTLYFGLLVETPKELSEYDEFPYMWLPWQWFVE